MESLSPDVTPGGKSSITSMQSQHEKVNKMYVTEKSIVPAGQEKVTHECMKTGHAA